MAKKDRPKTAFILPMGLFEFNRMPFGLTNAPGTFQRLMEHCLGDLNFESVLIYLDDVVVYGTSFEDHLQKLRQVLRRLRDHGLKVKPKKCQLFRQRIEYLGHVITPEGVRPTPSKVDAVRQWPQPRTLREVRAFLGLAGYYRRFVPKFAQTVGPINELLRGSAGGPKTRPVQWGPEQQKAFEAVKSALTSAPILAYARFDIPFQLYTDGSLHGLGAVLSQVQDGRERVIAYGSRALRESERNPENYSSFKLELLALVWAMTERFAEYLTGAEIVVMTDNNPLAHLSNAKLGALEQRWIARMSRFNYRIKFRSGRENGNADALSRVPVGRSAKLVDQDLEDTEIPDLGLVPTFAEERQTSGVGAGMSQILGRTVADWGQVQNGAPDVRKVRQWVANRKWPTPGERAALTTEGQRLLRQWDKLVVVEGLLCRKVYLQAELQTRNQVVIPMCMGPEVAREAHERGAHFGSEKTLKWLHRLVYCPELEQMVSDACAQCRACGLTKAPEQRAPIQSIRTSEPLELLMIDYVQIGYSSSGKQYCLVMTDHFTKYAVAVPTRDQTAESAAEAVCKHFIQVYGCPKRIHSDQGACFQGALMAELYSLYGIEKSRTTPYHPQGNGACERFNRTLIQMLRTLSTEQKQHWTDCVPELLWAYNNRVHATTGYSPHMLMFGRAGRDIEELRLPAADQPPPRDTSAWVQEHRRRLRAVHKIAGDRLAQVEHPNPRPVQRDPFRPGDRVLVRLKRPAGKLDLRWEAEPYVIKRRVSPDNPVYEVEPAETMGPARTLHRDMLRPCGFESERPRGQPAVGDPGRREPEPDIEWWVDPEPDPVPMPLPPRPAVTPLPVTETMGGLEVTDAVPLRRTTRANAGVPPQRYANDEFVWGLSPRTATSSGVECGVGALPTQGEAQFLVPVCHPVPRYTTDLPAFPGYYYGEGRSWGLSGAAALPPLEGTVHSAACLCGWSSDSGLLRDTQRDVRRSWPAAIAATYNGH